MAKDGIRLDFDRDAIRNLLSDFDKLSGKKRGLTAAQYEGAMARGMSEIRKEARANARKLHTNPEKGSSVPLKFRRELARAIGFKKVKKGAGNRRTNLKVILGVITPRTEQTNFIKLTKSQKASAIDIKSKDNKFNIALFQELGTTDRIGGRGRIKPTWFLYRAFRAKKSTAFWMTHDDLIKRMVKLNPHLRYLKTKQVGA